MRSRRSRGDSSIASRPPTRPCWRTRSRSSSPSRAGLRSRSPPLWRPSTCRSMFLWRMASSSSAPITMPAFAATTGGSLWRLLRRRRDPSSPASDGVASSPTLPRVVLGSTVFLGPMRPSLLVAAAAILLAGRSVLAQSAPSAPPSSTAPAAPPPPNQAAPPPATSPPAASPLPTSYPPQQAYPPPPGYPAQPGYPPSGAPRPPPDAHSHAGFFLRMALGIGYMADSAKIEGGAYAGEVDARGVAVPLELAIGGAISPGFILAGSFTFQGLSRPNLTNDTRLMRPDHRPQLTMLALMADIYPNPKQGFHVGGGLGF